MRRLIDAANVRLVQREMQEILERTQTTINEVASLMVGEDRGAARAIEQRLRRFLTEGRDSLHHEDLIGIAEATNQGLVQALRWADKLGWRTVSDDVFEHMIALAEPHDVEYEMRRAELEARIQALRKARHLLTTRYIGMLRPKTRLRIAGGRLAPRKQ